MNNFSFEPFVIIFCILHAMFEAQDENAEALGVNKLHQIHRSRVASAFGKLCVDARFDYLQRVLDVFLHAYRQQTGTFTFCLIRAFQR